jgi:hypothetical protein
LTANTNDHFLSRTEEYKMTDVVMEVEEEVVNKENIQIKQEEEINNGLFISIHILASV